MAIISPRQRRKYRLPTRASWLIAALVALGACRSDAGGGVEQMPPFDATVVTLTPAQEDSLAQLARDSVHTTVADGLSLSLWAPEQLIADPIGISIDNHGTAFVTRTGRTNHSEIDIRQHPDWMIESMTFTSIEDKRDFYLRELAPARSDSNQWLEDYNGDGSHDWHDLTIQKESVYRIEDRSGDGRADYSQVIAEDFNDVISDVAHGILALGDQLILTLSPDVWSLRDTDGDGTIDTRESLAHGSGVHIGFGGHGLSSPVIGPDGRLYWKMGDLGLNYTTPDGRNLANTRSGTIMRSNLDGSDMEIFATGLRNPEEFAFDEYGNMISADNDGDHPGETERLVYITEGSDAGWRINWQFGKYVDPDNNDYNVWMREGLFKPRFEGQAAYITPPIASYHTGPSGLVYNPGTALSDEWDHYFFVSSFPGSAAGASVYAFKLAPNGAGFQLEDEKEALHGILAVGMDFGPDGALYVNDWISGWDPKGRGRIWKLDTPATDSSAIRLETKELLAASFDDRSNADLVALLAHPDMRVRMKAQFALVDRGAADDLLGVARDTGNQLARIHALWGIGQLARKDMDNAAVLPDFLHDGDPEIRAQAAKLLGDLRFAPAADSLVALLEDAAPRPRFFAAQALGRLAYKPAIQPIITMLRENDGEDVYLRQAGTTALALIGDPAPIAALATDPSRAVRLAAVVVLRRMKSPRVADFLHDSDEAVVTEAARAINDDGGIEAALPALAAMLDSARFTSEPLTRREINANLRVGTAEAARRVASYAARTAAPDSLRGESVAVLGVWPAPSILDRVDGVPIGEMHRDTAISRDALAAVAPSLFSNGGPMVQIALADAAARLGLTSAAPTLLAKVRSGATPEVRIAALDALNRLHDEHIKDAVQTALQDPEARVRMAALTSLSDTGLPADTVAGILTSVVRNGEVPEQQAALASLGTLGTSSAVEALSGFMDELTNGDLDPEIILDVTEAARATGSAPLVARADQYEAAQTAKGPMAAYADALLGGDARSGRQVVFRNPTAQCARCHTLPRQGNGGADVGPALEGVGSRLSREQLLQALVEPSARIAPGFGAPGTTSAMPPMGAILSHAEIRDVVAYLATLQ